MFYWNYLVKEINHGNSLHLNPNIPSQFVGHKIQLGVQYNGNTHYFNSPEAYTNDRMGFESLCTITVALRGRTFGILEISTHVFL